MEANTTGTRKRTQIACFECRKNKRKCGGESPSCTLCTRNGKPCSYPSENAPRKRKYWDEDYVHSLERQIETLQGLIRELRAQLSSTERSFSSPRNADLTNIEKAYEQNELQGLGKLSEVGKIPSDNGEIECVPSSNRSQTAVDELSSLMLRMGIGDVGEPCFSIPSVAIEALMKQDNSVRSIRPAKVCTDQYTAITTNKRNEGQDHLLDLFMRHFNPYHQFLDPTCPEVQAGFADPAIMRLQRTDVQFLTNAVYAVGAHFLDTEHDNGQMKEYSSRALSLMIDSCSQYPGATAIKGLSLMCWVEMMTGNENLSWIYNTIATGMILMLGFHVTSLEKFSDATRPEMAEEIASRVRTFWAYFSVDRIATAILGLNCTIPWRRVRAHRISSILDSRANIEEVAFDYQYQMWHLWDSVMDQVNAFAWNETSNSERQRQVLEAHQALQSFHKSIPGELAMRKHHVHPAVILYHMAYHTAVLLTYRPLLNEVKESTVMRLTLHSITVAATSVARLLRRFRSSSQRPSASQPQIISYILSAAIIHLLNATAGNGSRTGKQAAVALLTCLNTLDEMRGHWGYRVSKAIRLIQGLAQRWAVVWALPMRFSSLDPGLEIEREGVLVGDNSSIMRVDNTEVTGFFDSEFDFWGRLDIDELRVDENSTDHFSDGNALDWLFIYESTKSNSI